MLPKYVFIFDGSNCVGVCGGGDDDAPQQTCSTCYISWYGELVLHREEEA